MATIPWFAIKAQAPASWTAGITRYLSLGQGWDASVFSLNTTEAVAQVITRTAGTFSKLTVRIVTNDRGSSTLTFRKNTAAGNQSVSIGASTTGTIQDTSNSDSVTAGDLVALQMVVGSGGTTFSTNGWAGLFAATTDTSERLQVSWPATITDGVFVNLCGARTTGGTEASQAGPALIAGTVKNWVVRVSANSRDGTTTFTSRKNGGNGNGAVSVTATSTGNFEDSSNSDTVAQDDTFGLVAGLAGSSGTITLVWIARDFVTSTGLGLIHNAENSGNITSGLTRYTSIAGAGSSWQTTESDTHFPAIATVTASRLSTYLASNSLNGSSTLTFRVAGGDTSLQVSLTAATTGRFTDNTNTASVTNLDLVSVKCVTGGSSGLMAAHNVSWVWGDNSAGAAAGQPTSKRMAWIPFGAHGKQPGASVWGV